MLRYLSLVAAACLFTSPMGAATRVPVLLELFTSEGCSSCPSADRLLEKLDRDQPLPGADLIVLSEHVDYWNSLGWNDPFSSAGFSERQERYAQMLRIDGVYTPQLVVDGTQNVSGNDASGIARAVAKALPLPKSSFAVSATRDGDSATVHITRPPALPGGVDLFVVAAHDHVQSEVNRGENAGRALTHVAVAYRFQKVSHSPDDVHLKLKPGQTRIVAFLQDHDTGQILAASQTKI